MYRKVIYLTALFITLSMAGNASADLVGQWTLDGVGTDSSGNGNDGTLENNPTVVEGQIGQALAFDDSRVAIPVSDTLTADLFTGSFTLSGWINPPRTGNTWQQIFRAVMASGSSNDTLFLNNDGRLSWRGRVNGGWAGGMCETAPDVVPADQWTHFAVVGDGTNFRIYVDGELSQESAFQTTDGTNATYYIGGTSGGESYSGMVDELRVYNHVLSEDEIKILAARPKAEQPDPANGAKLEQTWAALGWRAGDFAVSHDVYLSDNFDDVNDRADAAYQGNLPMPFLTVGFAGFPFPDGLVPGTTYYWRVDEINPDDPDSPWEGPVWSFWIPPLEAFEPSPADGGQYADTEPILTWASGFGAKLHNVVFGDNFDDVSNAPAGTPQASTQFAPGALEPGKTYYWRVDEFNPPTTVKGPVWSFTTLPELPIVDPNLVAWYKFEIGKGKRIVDFSGHGNHAEIIDNVLWVPGQFNLGLEFLGDNKGHVEMPAGLVTTASGSISMWVNTDLTTDEGMFWYGTESGGDGFGGENEIHINIDDPGVLMFFIEGATDINIRGPVIAGAGWNHVAATWDLTDGCRLYFNGEQVDFAAHNNTVVDLSTIRLGRPVGTGNGNRYHDGLMDDVRLFDHAVTAAAINEIMTKGEDPRRAGSPSPANGSLAAINIATTLTWSAGEGASQHDVYFGTDQAAVTDADASDTSGVYVGRQNATSYTPDGITMNSGPFYWRIDEVANDGTIVEGGVWSFSVADFALVDDFESYNDIPAGEPGSNLVYIAWVDGFDNPNVNGSTIGYVTGASMETDNVHGGNKSVPLTYNNATAGVSEVVRTLTPAQDWTAHGVITLSLWFAGDAANVPGQLYVKINGVQVNYDGDMSNLTRAPWQVWNIDLTTVGTNLNNVTSLAIGIQGPGATGTMLLDDIRLYAMPRELITPVQPDPAGLVAHFTFEGNANDSVGGHNGVPNGGPTYQLGKFGQAITLDGVDDYVVVGSVGISGTDPRTIAGWAKANILGTPAWVDVFGFTGPSGTNGHFDIELVGNTSTTTLGWYGIHVYGWEQDILPIDLEWHHLAASYDGTTVNWYGDGLLVGSADRTLNTPDNVHVGKREDNSNFFPGQVDDVRIYNRVLSDAEMAGLAGITQPFDKPF